MIINSTGLGIIMQFESLKLEAYQCPSGIWTIGYGHTLHVKKGDLITAPIAIQLLYEDIERIEKQIKPLVLPYKVGDNSWSALVSLIFNIGVEAFEKSTLLKYLSICKLKAADEFPRWKYGTNSQGSRMILPGLIKRRSAERDLFLK